VQLALLLIVARLGAELCKRMGLPASSVSSRRASRWAEPARHFAPEVAAFLFPPVAEQFHLLEVVGRSAWCCCSC
jgi:hypothetical protein